MFDNGDANTRYGLHSYMKLIKADNLEKTLVTLNVTLSRNLVNN